MSDEITKILDCRYFDSSYYSKQANLTFGSDRDAAAHYSTIGWRLGLNPSSRFDTTYYLSTNIDVASAGLNPLTHFISFGSAEGRKPSAGADPRIIAESRFFDQAYYSAQCGRWFRDKAHAASHYIAEGWRLGFNPSQLFDTRYYLAANNDVLLAGANPLAHYLSFGAGEGRKPRIGSGPFSAKPTAPSDQEWRDLLPRASLHENNEQAIEIIIPVYKGYDDTLACIFSVLSAKNRTTYRLTVINDCSPDSNLRAKLAELAEDGFFRLVENATNLGFVGTVNRGIREAAARDVILLNSDTIVYHDWIDRLVAHRSDQVATITPMSNNATIFSYPFTDCNNHFDLEIDYANIDSIFSEVNRRSSIEVPTGVGFCMFVSRKALDIVGLFDAELFGRGYGEENDFCQRSIESGFSNLAALDVFVRHTGEVSFSETAQGAKTISLQRLSLVHSRYEERISTFVKRNPFLTARTNVDLARVRRRARNGVVLHIEHGWGGGIRTHIENLTEHLSAEGLLSLRGVLNSQKDRLQVVAEDALDMPNLPSARADDANDIANLIMKLNVTILNVHSFVGFADAQMQAIIDGGRTAKVRLVYTIHDYAIVCPQINMIDWSGTYCGSGSSLDEQCKRCLVKKDSPFGNVDVNDWREVHLRMIRQFDQVLVPHSDVADRLIRNFNFDTKLVVRTHPYRMHRETVPRRPTGLPSDARSIGIIGAIGPHKGSDVLFAMAADALARKLPLDYVIFGYTNRPELDSLPNIRITGPYQNDLFSSLLDGHKRCRIAAFLSVWPETFCYALDLALDNGLHPVCFDIGAAAERIRDLNVGSILPLEWAYNVRLINDFLLSVELPNDSQQSVEEERSWPGFRAYYGESAPLSGAVRSK